MAVILSKNAKQVIEAVGRPLDEHELALLGTPVEAESGKHTEVEEFLRIFSGKHPGVEEFLRKRYDLTTDAYEFRNSYDIFIQVYSTTDLSRKLRYDHDQRQEIVERLRPNYSFDRIVFCVQSLIDPFHVHS